jgi:hypothetical protein
MVTTNQNPSHDLTTTQTLLVVGSSLLSIVVGLLCVLYHALAIWLTVEMTPNNLIYALRNHSAL